MKQLRISEWLLRFVCAASVEAAVVQGRGGESLLFSWLTIFESFIARPHDTEDAWSRSYEDGEVLKSIRNTFRKWTLQPILNDSQAD